MPDIFTTDPTTYAADPQITDTGKITGYVVQPEDWLEILGALRRVNQALYRREFNVRHYGAVGDGSTDDTVAIQAALTAAGAVQGKVVLGPGTWRTTAPLHYGSNVSIVGQGAQASTIAFTGSGYALAPLNPGTRAFNLHVEGVQITVGVGATGGLDLTDMSIALIDRVTIIGQGLGTGIGIRVAGTQNGFAVYNAFRHVRCSALNYGWSIEGLGSNDTHLFDCRPVACARGVSIVDANHVIVKDSAIEGNTRGVYVESTTSSLADGCTIVGNRFEGNTTANIAVGGTPANVRLMVVGHNHHVTAAGTTYENVLSTTNLVKLPDVGGAGAGFYIDSPLTSGPCFTWMASQTGVNAVLFRHRNIGSGSPFVLRLSAGRPASHALSIAAYTEPGGTPTDTEVASIDGAGNLIAVAGTFSGAVQGASLSISGDATFTGVASAIVLGDGTNAGNAQSRYQKPDTGNQSFMLLRVGASAAGNRWLRQHDSSENVNWIVCDGSGNTLAILPLSLRYVATNGRTYVSVARLTRDRSTALQASDVAISAGWGTGASVSAVLAGSNFSRGQITITAGSTPAANPTITITDPDGTWAAAGITTSQRNGGTDTLFMVPGQHWTTTDNAATIVFTMVGTPTNGNTVIIRWDRSG